MSRPASAHSADEERQFVEAGISPDRGGRRRHARRSGGTRSIRQRRQSVQARVAPFASGPADAGRGTHSCGPAGATTQDADRSTAADGIKISDAAQKPAEIPICSLLPTRRASGADPAQSGRDAFKSRRTIPAGRAARAVEILEMAAFAEDVENFTPELGEALILPSRIAAEGGERSRRRTSRVRLAGAGRARRGLSAGADVPQPRTRFIRAVRVPSIEAVRSLERTLALVMLAAWRGSTVAATRPSINPRSTTTNANARARRPRRAVRPCSPARQRSAPAHLRGSGR